MSDTENTELAAGQNTALANPSPISGFSASDIDIPRINIVQKMSDLDAPNGAIVLDKEFVLAEVETPLHAYVLFAEKLWKEDSPFDSDYIPRIVSTEAEAKELSADSEFGVLEFANISLLIKQPDGGDEEVFTLPIGDDLYAIGKLTVQKDAYRRTYKSIATHATFHPKADLASVVWTFQSEPITKGKYSWWVPTLRATNVAGDPAVVQFRKNLGL